MSLQSCLRSLCDGRWDCVRFPSDLFYKISWAQPYNLDIPVIPAAVFRPDDAHDVAAAVKCASEHGVPVQAKSGGHSYG